MSVAEKSFQTSEKARCPDSRRASKLADLLEEARQRLIDTGARNRLIHTNRQGKRPSTLCILTNNSDRLFRRLVHESVAIQFCSDHRVTTRSLAKNEDGHIHALRLPSSRQAGRAVEEVLQTRLGEEALQKKLLKFFRDAKTLEEEQGINILFLAFGFLRWFEDEKSNVPREAPLILVPVTVLRDLRRAIFSAKVRDEDISINLPLAERMKEQGVALPEIPSSEGWDLSEYFESVRQAIGGQPRWSIDHDGVELGFFSFAKLLMFHDLSGASWPNGEILEHPLVNGLLLEGFSSEEPLFPADTKIDEKFAPEDLLHIVDADGSQALAIETVRAGRNLVIQGPPGTGKSQTIANIIAAAVYDGKSVLFVAEKLVALKIVHDRLDAVGLGDICLELHSRASNKRLLAQELGRTLDAVRSVQQGDSSSSGRLREARDRLNAIDLVLHQPIGRSGVSAFLALGTLIRATQNNLPPPQLNIPNIADWDNGTFARMTELTARLATAAERIGNCDGHPWHGVGNFNLQPTDLTRVKERCGQILPSIAEIQNLANQGATAATSPLPQCLRDIHTLGNLLLDLRTVPLDSIAIIRHVLSLADTRRNRLAAVAREGLDIVLALRELEKRFTEESLKGDLTGTREALALGAASMIARWGGQYRKASRSLQSWLLSHALPQSACERLTLLDDLLDFKAHRDAIDVHMTRESDLFGPFWRGCDTDFDAFCAAAEWLSKISAPVPTVSALLCLLPDRENLTSLGSALITRAQVIEKQCADLRDYLRYDRDDAVGATVSAPLSDIRAQLSGWKERSEQYGEWVEFQRLSGAVADAGSSDIVAALGDGRLTPRTAADELKYARAEALWKYALEANSCLSRQLGDERFDLVRNFRTLEAVRREEVVKGIKARHARAIPQGANGEMGVIRGEIARQRGHIPIRKFIQRTGSILQKIKPVFLMSPISVAQYLVPGSITFDLVVIDEASQVRPEDALGVCARAEQIVIVGDKHQLPPTGFFTRLLDDELEEEDDNDDAEPRDASIPTPAARVGEMESILTLSEARGVPHRMLLWHYRSRHPSLIEVSNVEFYGSRLLLPPSPHPVSSADGLRIRRVEGAYDRGGSRTNAIEAHAVVDAMVAHAAEHSDQSLGIVTFSVAQRDLISSLVDERRRKDLQFDEFLRSASDEGFIKNLENVQGDERDVIMISVGYGPRQAGQRLDSMHFGPVSADGGERRLNVLFTRARIRCEVFVSFESGDIDHSRAKAQGARVLQRFLAFAETGKIDQPELTNAEHDSPFEADVAEAIRAFGYQVDPQVGSAGFKIDLGVRHSEKPGRYILAVECDGATYHRAAWARERDRQRQEILEAMGWKFHRIWSTDWFYRRSAELQRLRTALEEARNSIPG